MKIKITIIAIGLLSILSIVNVNAQEFTLKQCIEYAVKNSSSLKTANIDSKISGQVVNEQTGKGLPQINFSSTLEDKLKITTQLLPGEMLGKPGTFVPVKFGTKYNLNATFSLTQKVFDASFWVGLKAAKISEDLSMQNISKASEQTIYDVTSSYYRALILKKKLENYKSILESSKQVLKSIELKFKTGVAKKLDVDKIKVNYNNTNFALQQTELSYKQSLNTLKYYMGMPIENPIEIENEFPEIIEKTVDNIDNKEVLGKRIDYQILKTNLALYEADKENNIMAYLPTLNFYANYGYSAQRSQFDFFNKDKNWFSSSAIGLELKVPIFSGLQKYSKVEQSQLNIEKSIENMKRTEEYIKVELSNYQIQFNNAVESIKNERDNLQLAEDVYRNTQLEFNQGSCSSMELVQAESSLRETQNNYYSKLLTLYLAKLDLDKSQGAINNFINNQK